jgi:predicted dinucleotide-binding enzyme
MKIAVIGAGHLGSSLAKVWAARGHDVTLGVREDSKHGQRSLPPGLKAATIEEAAGSSDVVTLCVPWMAVREAIREAGDLAGKVVIDATNPLLEDVSGLAIGTTTSAGEEIAGLATTAKVVKAFNSLGSYLLGDADFGGQRADGYYCGDDAAAKDLVRELIADAGLEPVDVGPLSNARLLEPLALLWIDLLFRQGQPKDFAFKLLHRKPRS